MVCIKAGSVAGMASSSDLFYFCEKGILIAVDGKRFYILEVSRSFSLDPLTLSAAAEISHAAGFDGMLKSLLIHIATMRTSFVL